MAPPPGVRSSPDHLPPPSSPGNCVTVVCKRTDGLPMKSLSPWTVDDKLRPLSTRPLDAELTLNGQDLRIRADDCQHARLLTEITGIVQVPVTITTTTTTTQGSIWAPEMDMLDTDVILQGFASQGVTAVYRPPRGPKALLLVTIDGSTLPHRLQAGYLSYEFRVVVPKPRCCAHCQRYGHQAAKCRSGVVCDRCAEPHETNNCTSDNEHCAACGGDHATSDSSCPKWKLEMRVSTLIAKEKQPPREARLAAERELGLQVPTRRRRLADPPPKPGDLAAFPPMETPSPQTPPTVRRRHQQRRPSNTTSSERQTTTTESESSDEETPRGAQLPRASSRGKLSDSALSTGTGPSLLASGATCQWQVVGKKSKYTKPTAPQNTRSAHTSPERQPNKRRTRGHRSTQ